MTGARQACLKHEPKIMSICPAQVYTQFRQGKLSQLCLQLCLLGITLFHLVIAMCNRQSCRVVLVILIQFI